MILRLLLLILSGVSMLAAAPVEILPAELRGALQPQLAVAPSGRIHVVFGKENAIYHTSSADGRVFSKPVKVGEIEKLALRMRRGPRVAVAGQRVIVTAISHQDGMLHCWSSPDEGRTWREQARLNSPAKSAGEGLHSMAGDAHGLVAVAWLDLRNKGTELWRRISRDGGESWGAETRVYAWCHHGGLYSVGSRGERLRILMHETQFRPSSCRI